MIKSHVHEGGSAMRPLVKIFIITSPSVEESQILEFLGSLHGSRGVVITMSNTLQGCRMVEIFQLNIHMCE